MEKSEIVGRLRRERLVLVLNRGRHALNAAQTALAAGVPVVEVTVAEGVEELAELARAARGWLPGAGGVSTAQQAWEAVEAGARFVCAAPIDAEIAAVCEAADVPVVAMVDGLPALEAALPLRPDFLRVRSDLGLAPPTAKGSPLLMVELTDIEADTVSAALAAGASVVVVAESVLATSGDEDLHQKLGGLRRSLEDME